MEESGKTPTPIAAPTTTRVPPIHGLKLNRGSFKGILIWLSLVWKRFAWLTILEVVLITAWAVWVSRGYLDFSPSTWPQGDGLPVVVESHFVWTLLTKCGACMLWNGFINGGAPAFAELMGSVVHPLTAVTTVLLGVANSIKLELVISLIMAGLSQWWLVE